MKLVTAFLLVSGAVGFAPSAPFGVNRALQEHRLPSCLQERPDSADAVAKALEATKKYGATSKEARLAWDIVEEMDASDNSGAYSGGVSDEECSTDASDAACLEYNEKMEALTAILAEQQEKISKIKNLASEIQSLKMPTNIPTESKGPDSDAMQAALKEAREATEQFGADSKEAVLAWETVEEVAASDNSQAYAAPLDEECLVEAMEACEALEEITRAIGVTKQGGSRYSG